MSVSSPVSYQLLRLIKWRINGVIKGPNDPREGKIGLKGKMGAITADTGVLVMTVFRCDDVIEYRSSSAPITL